MADKKVASASREKEEQILKLQRKVEESQVQLSKKEKWVNPPLPSFMDNPPLPSFMDNNPSLPNFMDNNPSCIK